jgi:hypothetical protein
MLCDPLSLSSSVSLTLLLAAIIQILQLRVGHTPGTELQILLFWGQLNGVVLSPKTRKSEAFARMLPGLQVLGWQMLCPSL